MTALNFYRFLLVRDMPYHCLGIAKPGVPSWVSPRNGRGQGCIGKAGALEEVPDALRQAVGGGCQSGWAPVTGGYKCHRSWHLASGGQWMGIDRGMMGLPMHPWLRGSGGRGRMVCLLPVEREGGVPTIIGLLGPVVTCACRDLIVLRYLCCGFSSLLLQKGPCQPFCFMA